MSMLCICIYTKKVFVGKGVFGVGVLCIHPTPKCCIHETYKQVLISSDGFKIKKMSKDYNMAVPHDKESFNIK